MRNNPIFQAMNLRITRKGIPFLLILLFITNATFANAGLSAEQTESMMRFEEQQVAYSQFDKDVISVIFAESDTSTRTTATSLVESLRLLSPNILSSPVGNIYELETSLSQSHTEVVVFILPTTTDGITFVGNLLTPWDQFISVIKVFDDREYVFASGNSNQLNNTIGDMDNLHLSGEEQLDARHVYTYAMWTIAELLENHKNSEFHILGKNVRMATLKYFGNNFNELISTTIVPKHPMGALDEERLAQDRDQFMEEHPVQVERHIPEGYRFDSDLQRMVSMSTNEVNQDYTMDLISADALLPGEYPVNYMPDTSGLRGPIGGIIDNMLPYLLSDVGNVIGLSASTVESIVRTIQTLPETIGLLANPSSSEIVDLIESIKPMLPISEDQMKYVDLIIHAIFGFRDGIDGINSYIMEIIPLLIPDDSLMINGMSVRSIVEEFLEIGTEIADQYNNGNGITDFLVQSFNQKVLLNLTRNVLQDTSLLLSETEIDQTLGLVGGIIGLILSLSTTGDVSGLINQYGPQIPSFLAPMIATLDVSSQHMELIMAGIGMLLVATGVIEGPSLQDLINQVLIGFTGLSLDESLTYAKDLMAQINDALNADITNVTDFQNNYLQPVLDIMVQQGILTTSMSDTIIDLLSLVMAVTKEDFNLNGIVNVSDMITGFLSSLGVIDPETVSAIDDIITYLTVAIDFIYAPPNFGKILSDLYNDITTLFYDMVAFAVNMVNAGTVTMQSMQSPDTIQIDAQNINILTLAEAIGTILQLVKATAGNSVENLLLSLMQTVTFFTSFFLDFDLTPYVELVKSFFGEMIDLKNNPPKLSEILQVVYDQFDPEDHQTIELILGGIYIIYELFNGGFKTIFAKLTEWVFGKGVELIEDLSKDIESLLDLESWDLVDLEIPIEIGPYSFFTVDLSLSLLPNLEFNQETFSEMLTDLIFRSTSIFGDQVSNEQIMDKVMSFITISPNLLASFELTDFGSSDPSFFDFMMESFGLDLIISGAGSFEISIFSFSNGVFNTESLLKIVFWSFKFQITIQKTLTLLDLLLGGAGGGLKTIAKYIGLDIIELDIWFTLTIEIIKRAASALKPETSSLILTITFGLAASLHFDLEIAELELSGSLEIKFTLLQDLLSPTPMKIFTSIVLTIYVYIEFLWKDWDWTYTWYPEGYGPYEVNAMGISPDAVDDTFTSPEDALNAGALGGDADNDGLSDAYESKIPGLDPYNPDSDGDGLSDKLEIQSLGTDATHPDTDRDGLTDDIEFEVKTNPFYEDSDFDQISDYDEIMVYHTDPMAFDTDEDGLTDFYEINHAYNISGITPTVSNILIGDKYFDDHTDPLNKDTDGDGLLDGEEDIQGIYYGPELFDFSQNDNHPGAEPSNVQTSPIRRNGGYTHPLDSDTDDDSYRLDSNGDLIYPLQFIYGMSDYDEIHGIPVIFKVDGIPQPEQIVRTNPISPDSDLDGLSDGYELANGPTDPLDGDTDNDGLMDGLEGMNLQDSNHTDPTNADTDGDKLGDLQEIQMGSDPRSADTDRDGLSDYEEFFIFGTNLFLDDTDSDLIVDGDEVWFYHTNPFSADTDGDGLSDYTEIFYDTSNPISIDSDGDLISDWDEIYLYYTDPWDMDSDNDGLVDGDEVLGLNYTRNQQIYTIYTDPNNPDTDSDSINILDENGEKTLSLNDYEEYMQGTDPTSSDSDLDGISDAWELWLQKGRIPGVAPIMMDPLSDDTDNDGLVDGLEIMIANHTTLTNPYIARYLIFPYNTLPDVADTDSDGLDDGIELNIGTSPNSQDSDNDSLSDFAEYSIYQTNPAKNDTDGDGLSDSLEINGYDPLNLALGLNFNPDRVIFTDPINSDSDQDLLPDGAEVFFYYKDPNDQDQDQNNVLDGMEIDSDYDGLYDGEEFYVYDTVISADGGGIFQPDSDHDGLFDGQEVYHTNTRPDYWDTDNDTLSDGLEHSCGTDPLDESTTVEDLKTCFNSNQTIIIISPLSEFNYSKIQIPVLIFDYTNDLEMISFTFKNSQTTEWSQSYDLSPSTKEGYWSYDVSNLFDGLTGNITMKFAGIMKDGSEFTLVHSFIIDIHEEPDFFFITAPLADSSLVFSDSDTISIPIMVRAGLSFNKVTFDLESDEGEIVHNQIIHHDYAINAYYLPDFTISQQSDQSNYTLTAYGMTTSGDQVQDQIQFLIILLPADSVTGSNVLMIGSGVAVITLTSTFFGRKRIGSLLRREA